MIEYFLLQLLGYIGYYLLKQQSLMTCGNTNLIYIWYLSPQWLLPLKSHKKMFFL